MMGFFFMKNNKTTLNAFKLLFKNGNKCIPVYKRILADVLTPVGVWNALNQNIDYGFIFESVEKNIKRSRYSYIGINPNTIFISKGSKTPRTPYNKVVINEEVEQKWSGDYLYAILPKLDKYGNFEEDVNVKTSYGVSNAPITNMKESSRDLVFDLDLNQDTTEDIIDKTRYTVLDYYKDFEVFLDDDLRLQIKGKIKPDTIEKSSVEQAF